MNIESRAPSLPAVATAAADANDKVGIDRDGAVLVITIRNPPINAGSLDVRRGVLAAIRQLSADDTLAAGVIIGGGSTFIAGSDLREFGRPLEEPQLPAVIAAVETCPKPVVAAIHGAALGGGFELALGCDARIATRQAIVGLPEVTLGMIPGAGGTQRLPRLVGCARAVSMICSGERMDAGAAKPLGIVDVIAEGDLRQSAVAFARSLDGKHRLRERAVPADAPEAIAAATRAALKAGRDRPWVKSAIERVLAAQTEPIDEALAKERALFQQYRHAPEAAALRHLFFAEREASRSPAAGDSRPRAIAAAGVVGGGTMGCGIAVCLSQAGIATDVVERDDAAARQCSQRLKEHFDQSVQSGRIRADVAAACLARVRVGTDWSRLSDTDLVIEAVIEDLATKREVFTRLDATLKAGAVLATNTSYLDLDAIAGATKRPQDVIGLHFFSPAPATRLLEIVRGRDTAADVLATGLDLARRLKKQPVVAGNAFGFIGNRIFNAYRRQCEFMLEEGATPASVDQALQRFGFAMGPFAVADMSGLDIAWRMRQVHAAARNAAERYVKIPDWLCEMGRLGRKTGAGYYRYEEGARAGLEDPVVLDLLARASAEKAIERRVLTDEEIVHRALAAMVNEAAQLVSEGVAARASDIDVTMVHGYGFPRWEGGPVYRAQRIGREALEAEIDRLAAFSGPGFRRADLRSLFGDAAAAAQ